MKVRASTPCSVSSIAIEQNLKSDRYILYTIGVGVTDKFITHFLDLVRSI